MLAFLAALSLSFESKIFFLSLTFCGVISTTKENVEKIGVSNRINIFIGDAIEILPTINNEYDIIFIDAAKGKYPVFLEHGIKLVKNEGLAESIWSIVSFETPPIV